MEIYVLDKDLNTVAMFDEYKSLIWSNRYNEVGDCELYVPATDEALSALQMGYFLRRDDDEMVCQIRKIELDTSAEDGNYIVVSGVDVKAFLDQRIIWGTVNLNGNVAAFLNDLVEATLADPALSSRQLQKSDGSRMLYIDGAGSLTETATEQISYANLGEKVREYCKAYGWGYMVYFDAGKLVFCLYRGSDVSDSVIFSDQYENLASSAYVEDNTHLANVALVAGEGAGADRSRSTYGYGEGVDRHEIFVDARDISRTMTYKELTTAYPLQASGGQGYVDGTQYKMAQLDVKLIDGNQSAWLQSAYTGTVITQSDGQYYRMANIAIADLASGNPNDDTSCSLLDVVYSGLLLSKGETNISAYGSVQSFEGTIVPDVTFVYKEDYYLGDTVAVQNEFGIGSDVQIVEVIEVDDDNGYRIEPHFEYLQTSGVGTTIPAGQEIDYEAGAQTMTEAKLSGGSVSVLNSTSVKFSNGLVWARARQSVSPGSGTAWGTTGLYQYKTSVTFTGGIPTATSRPIATADVYIANKTESVPAAVRFDGSANQWTTANITFYCPYSSISGTVTVEILLSCTL